MERLPIFEDAWRATHPRTGGRHRWRTRDQESSAVTTTQPPITTGIRYPHAAGTSYTARQVAIAYGAPVTKFDGTGKTVGIIELGGGYSAGDMTKAGLPSSKVTVVPVAGGKSQSDGPDGADGEVMLDVEVVAGVAPGAAIRVYFSPNTDAGFTAAIQQAGAECDVVSVSWGGAESQWSAASMKKMSAVIAALRAKGVPVMVASGDTGSRDSTGADVVDFPASDPNSVGCGGTKLTLNADGTRAAEVTWDENDTQSATGGGVSKVFPGRGVPDIAGNADPVTGYNVVVDGQGYVIGGTSAVAPLMAACYILALQAYGKPFDLVNTVSTNPAVCLDVTVGDNGGFRAGPGRDNVTGWGVISWDKLIAVLTSGTQIPAPGGGTTGGGGTTPPADDLATFWKWLRNAVAYLDGFLKGKGY